MSKFSQECEEILRRLEANRPQLGETIYMRLPRRFSAPASPRAITRNRIARDVVFLLLVAGWASLFYMGHGCGGLR